MTGTVSDTKVTASGDLSGTASCMLHSGGKLGDKGHYISLTLKEGESFKAGDYVVITVSDNHDAKTLTIYADQGTTQYASVPCTGIGDHTINLPASAIGNSTVVLYRKSKEDCNAAISKMVIYRPCCATPVITTQPQGATYCGTASIAALTIEASVSDEGTLSYQWYKDGAAITDATSNTYTPTKSGTYTVRVTNTKERIPFLLLPPKQSSPSILRRPKYRSQATLLHWLSMRQ